MTQQELITKIDNLLESNEFGWKTHRIKEIQYRVNTVGFWLSHIKDEEIRTRAFCNTPVSYLNRMCMLPELAICSMNWKATPEGEDFWYKVILLLKKR